MMQLPPLTLKAVCLRPWPIGYFVYNHTRQEHQQYGRRSFAHHTYQHQLFQNQGRPWVALTLKMQHIIIVIIAEFDGRRGGGHVAGFLDVYGGGQSGLWAMVIGRQP